MSRQLLQRLGRALLSVLFVFILVIPAPNAAPDPGWKLASLSTVQNGRGNARALVLYSTARAAHGIAFRCDRGRLYAMLAEDAGMLARNVLHDIRRAERADIKVAAKGQPQPASAWKSLRRGTIYVTDDEATAAAVYRSVAHGERLSVATHGRPPQALNVPAAEPATFARFRASCELRLAE